MATRRRGATDPRQLWLALDDMPGEGDGLDPAHRDSVFFATLPDPATAARLACFAVEQHRRHGLTGPLRATERLHVSLLALGKHADLSSRIIERAQQAAATVRRAPFAVAFDRALSFQHKGDHPFVLAGDDGMVGLAALREALGAALARTGLDCDAASRFTPHVTLLYDGRVLPEAMLDEPLGWTVRDFVLVHSRHGKGQYDYLGKWPLGAGRTDEAREG